MGCAGSKPGAEYAAAAGGGAARPGPRGLLASVHSEPVNGVCAGSRGEWLTASEDGSVARTDWASGRGVVERWRGHTKGVNRVIAPAALGGGCFTASRDTTIRQWARGAADATQTLRAHELTVSAIAARADAARLFSGSRDSSVVLWDVPTGQQARAVRHSPSLRAARRPCARPRRCAGGTSRATW